MTTSGGRAFNEALAERYGRWLVAQSYAPATRYYYVGAVSSFLEFLGNKSATKTSQVDVQEYLASAAGMGCPAYKLRERLYALRIFFDFLCLGGLIAWSPPRLVHMKRLRRHLPRVLSKTGIKKIFEKAESPREKVLLEVLYGTGIRCGELLSVRVREIDFKNRRFLVHGKAGDRVILFSRRVGNAIRQYLCGRGDGYLFRTVRQDSHSRSVGLTPLSDNCIQRDFRTLSSRAGIEVTARILRHTFATHMMDNGADLLAVRDLMGHKSLRTTILYTHMSKIPLRRAYDAYHPSPA